MGIVASGVELVSLGSGWPESEEGKEKRRRFILILMVCSSRTRRILADLSRPIGADSLAGSLGGELASDSVGGIDF